jgi:hypothetical protein
MSKVIATKANNVTEGVIDKALNTHEHLKSVTYADIFGTLHTVFAHNQGPFRSAEDVVKAAEDGVLHVFDSHKAAIEHWTDQAGNEALVASLQELDSQSGSTQSDQGSEA